MNKKNNFKLGLSKKIFLLSFIFSLHLLGTLVAFFRTDIRFHFHLLRFFSWWSVHTSILTVLAAVMIFRERKKTSSYFVQFFTLLATMYNLITFFFGVYCLFFLSVEGQKSLLSNLQSVSGHVIAPLLTIFYFYFYARVDKLKKKLVKTLLFSLISPIFYFFYVGTLAQLNHGETSSLFPHLPEYPYFIFEGIAKREGKQFVANFLIACLVFLSICYLVTGIKSHNEEK